MKTTNQKDPKFAVGYIRTKTGRGRSKMMEQLSSINTTGQKHDYKIAHCYIETGSKDQRILRHLLVDAEKSNWSAVIVDDRSRLSEDSAIYGQIEAELKQKGVEIILAVPDQKYGEN